MAGISHGQGERERPLWTLQYKHGRDLRRHRPHLVGGPLRVHGQGRRRELGQSAGELRELLGRGPVLHYWLQNGQRSDSDTEHGRTRTSATRVRSRGQPGATYFIPTENEWYKAAYYDPQKGGAGVAGYWDYPMMSDQPTVPSNDLPNPDGGNNANFYQNQSGYSGYTLGSPYYTTVVGDFENSASAYGTFDQGGNLSEWNEPRSTRRVGCVAGRSTTSAHLLASYRDFSDPASSSGALGFRVAGVLARLYCHVTKQCHSRSDLVETPQIRLFILYTFYPLPLAERSEGAS